MAEERNVGLARAPENGSTPAADADTDTTKAELQRRMEEARESITNTVNEIKETVTNQYQQVRETINDSLDWREQFRRRPLAFSAGALGAGLILGYSVAGAIKGGRDTDDDEDYYDADDDDLRASVSASRLGASPVAMPSAYAAQPVSGSVRPAAAQAYAPESRPSYSSGYEGVASAASYDEGSDEPQKPGLIQRVRESGVYDKFKETKAYDRLQEEVASLGDRFVEELSSTAKNVVLPALLGKLKDMIGIDLSTQREVAQRSRLEHQATEASADAKEAGDEREADSASARNNAARA